ncbi:Abi-domain-containing protein [Choiromyces venosus 120613-1]|uniref:intramembrane prenyl-peptidase Rce1 n=1 Tax=Choiromyces venosus 120613-1 TaxID=1336337 RepID=A0A3N4K5E6_9PEZI|nr:Abi-domain-containing protein [Choiromyces venosus 120613-1]
MSSIPEKEHLELTPFLANLFSVIYTSSYVGILYLSHLTRPQPGLARDTPFVIRARIRAVTVVTIIALVSSAVVTYFYSSRKTYLDIAEFLGLYVKLPLTLDILWCLLLTATLFLGPLVRRLWLEDGWREGNVGKMFTTWIGWRNYVAGPFTEEIVFRACMVPLHLLAGRSPGTIVFISPLFFGIAHFHHAYEFYTSNPHNPNRITVMITRSLFQFTYTTLFGWFATFLFLRTGSVWAAIITHSFCNFMGLPEFGPVEGQRWKSVVYYVLLVAGASGFYRLLWPLTESQHALVRF